MQLNIEDLTISSDGNYVCITLFEDEENEQYTLITREELDVIYTFLTYCKKDMEK